MAGSPAALRLRTPAKLNLLLHVLGRRPDGYHRLQTLFALIDLCDEVEVRTRDDGRVCLEGGVAGLDAEADLSVRAARLLRSETGTERGATIHVRKRIPVGGGLAGGSADAAAVLVGLNALWRLGLPASRLADLGLGLGADVPVLVRGRPAWAEGIGDRLTSVALPPAWYVVVTPPGAVSTRDVFAAPGLTRNTPHSTIRDFVRGPSAGGVSSISDIVSRGRNDCEPVTRALYPEVGKALDWLAARGAARMSGTGGSVFLAFDDEARARAVAAQAPAAWRIHVASGLDRSPLLGLGREPAA